MPIIDSQVHVYEANTPKRPWHGVPNWPPHVTGDEMVAAMDKVGVDGAIFISAFSLYQFDDPGLDRIAREAARHGFPVNVLFWGNLDAGTALIDRHPGTRFIVDHMALQQPRTPPAPPEPWADLPKVLELARRPNALIKVSGACTLSHKPYPFPDIWDPLARLFDAWGFERCLWGTDWTRTFAVVNYEQAVEPFLKTDRLSDAERAMLMGGACAKAYGWSPKKG